MHTNIMSNIRQSGSVTYEAAAIQQQDNKKEILDGLLSAQKYLNPKYFYDQTGSELFEAITQTPEYYPTRTERQLLQRNAAEIASYCQADTVLLEPGSGSCEKVRLLLEGMHPQLYVPMDISGDFLYQSAMKLSREFPWLSIRAICSDFSGENLLPQVSDAVQKVVFYPGSTIGNMTPLQAEQFLQRMNDDLSAGDLLILGVDLRKKTSVLNAAYNDAQGITAQFNLNILNHVNQLTGSNFSVSDFSHQAFFNEEDSRIEMHLVSGRQQAVSCCGREVLFDEGETLHTENSYKYSLEEIAQLAQKTGYSLKKSWVDSDQLFSVNLLEVG